MNLIPALIPLILILAAIASIGFALLLLQRLVQAVENIARILEEQGR